VNTFNRSLRNCLCLVALALPLSGCLLPPIITIASLALDAGSYAVSGKTMTDHGISLVAEEDCALMRVFEGHLCEDYQDYEHESVATLHPLETGGLVPGYDLASLDHADDPLAALPLGRREGIAIGNGQIDLFAANPADDSEASELQLGAVQFARAETEASLVRDFH
jgi:hypothetical protein